MRGGCVAPDGIGSGLTLKLVAAFLAAFFAAAINSVAGGGTLVSFPVLVALGLPSVVANATSTIGIWPGSLGSIWGFRREFARTDRQLRWLTLPCFAGGALGALLLRATTSATFDRIVPFLVLFATVLFALRARIQLWLQTHAAHAHRSMALAVGATFGVAVYGGYFGAGMSIMMLAVLGMIGLTDLLEMNALTSLFSLCVNAVAIALFVAAKLIYWPYVGAMCLGSLVGGYGAAGLARRIGRKHLARFVVIVGFSVSAIFFLRKWG